MNVHMALWHFLRARNHLELKAFSLKKYLLLASCVPKILWMPQ